MTTERIDIVIQETGSRVVKRSLADIGDTARSSSTGVDFLKRALAGLSVFLAVNKVRELADTYTNLQNRLRATGLEGDALAGVYGRLLKVANDTRSGLQGSIELYSRLAISAKELGVSQNDLIGFTKSLNQAITLSGASGQEAQAGLIQLSQGLASGTLRGDELRSVLEQLPAVADVIAKQLKVSRGELRKLGEEGKITAQTVIKAFQSAREELEQRFAKTVPTISQSFEVLKNNVIDLVGRLDAQTGASKRVSEGLIFVAKNLDDIALGMGKVAGLVLTLTAAYIAMGLATKAVALGAMIAEFVALRTAVAAGTVVMLGSAEADRQRAVAAVASAAATQAATVAQGAASVEAAAASTVATNAAVLRTTAERVNIETLRQGAIAKLASAQADIRSATAGVAAAEAAGAQSFAIAAKRTALAQLVAAEAAHAAQLTVLAGLDQRRTASVAAQTSALTAQAGAQSLVNKAAAEAAVANAAAAASTAKAGAAAGVATAAAARSTGLLAQAYAGVSAAAGVAFGAISKVFILINTNPFIFLATTIVLVIGLLATFGNDINSGADSVTSLLDVVKAFGEVAMDAFRAVGGFASSMFSGLGDLVGSALTQAGALIGVGVGDWLKKFTGFFDGVGNGFAGFLRGTARVIDLIAGLFTGVGIAILRAFEGLPGAVVQVFNRMYNGTVGVLEDLINNVVEGVNKVRSFVGASLLDTVKITKLEVNEKYLQDYGRSIASSISDGFEQQGGFAEKFINQTLDRAKQLGAMREEERRLLARQRAGSGAGLDAKGPPAPIKVDGKELKAAENALNSLLGTIAPTIAALQDMAKAYDVLATARKFNLISAEGEARYIELIQQHYKDLLDPLGAMDREYEKQVKLINMTADAREVEAQVMENVQTLLTKGIKLTETEVDGMRARLKSYQDLNKVVQEQDRILADTVGRRKQFVIQLEAIQKLLATPESGFRKEDVASALPEQFAGTNEEFAGKLKAAQDYYAQLDILREAGLMSEQSAQLQKLAMQEQLVPQDLFAGTQEAMDLQMARFQQMYSQIDMMRQADVISEQSAAMARARVEIQAQEARIAGARSVFAQLATLSTSGNKRLAAIGRAAAVTQATIDGVLAVQKALASAPPPLNYALAAAVGVAAAANVANILSQGGKGFKDGGYTGNMGTSQEAGVVHGQEFVVNADATRKNRPALEAMNNGGSLGGGGTVVMVKVTNTVSGVQATATEREGPNGTEVEVLIEKVVAKSVRRGGVVADALEGQYGLNRATGIAR